MSGLKRHLEWYTQREQPLKDRTRFWTWNMRGLHGNPNQHHHHHHPLPPSYLTNQISLMLQLKWQVTWTLATRAIRAPRCITRPGRWRRLPMLTDSTSDRWHPTPTVTIPNRWRLAAIRALDCRPLLVFRPRGMPKKPPKNHRLICRTIAQVRYLQPSINHLLLKVLTYTFPPTTGTFFKYLLWGSDQNLLIGVLIKKVLQVPFKRASHKNLPLQTF